MKFNLCRFRWIEPRRDFIDLLSDPVTLSLKN